jgi:hypothetical protein
MFRDEISTRPQESLGLFNYTPKKAAKTLSSQGISTPRREMVVPAIGGGCGAGDDIKRWNCFRHWSLLFFGANTLDRFFDPFLDFSKQTGFI